ncbi:hypothetical protein AINA4_12150 [Aurantimicrobium sp. INA4]|nr:hypothetical protein AINA4_12150 [Aurantimicrobium sp. INA4]
MPLKLSKYWCTLHIKDMRIRAVTREVQTALNATGNELAPPVQMLEAGQESAVKQLQKV